MKYILTILILAGIYFCAMGFLRTAERFGWSEGGAVSAPSWRK